MRFAVTWLFIFHYIYIVHSKKISKKSIYRKHGQEKYIYDTSKSHKKEAVSMPVILTYLNKHQIYYPHKKKYDQIKQRVKTDKNIPENPFYGENIPENSFYDENLQMNKVSKTSFNTDVKTSHLNWPPINLKMDLEKLHRGVSKLAKYMKYKKKAKKRRWKSLRNDLKEPHIESYKWKHRLHSLESMKENFPRTYKEKTTSSNNGDLSRGSHNIVSVNDIPLEMENVENEQEPIDKDTYLNILRRRKEKHEKYNAKKNNIPFPSTEETKRNEIFYNRRNELPLYSNIPTNSVQNMQLLSYPAQYPELLNIQPMDKLYTSVQGLDLSEEETLGRFLKKENIEEEKFKQSDVDKIMSDDKGDLLQDGITNHASNRKILDESALNEISNADLSSINDIEKLSKNILKTPSRANENILMGASLLDQNALKDHSKISQDKTIDESYQGINNSPTTEFPFKITSGNESDQVVTISKENNEHHGNNDTIFKTIPTNRSPANREEFKTTNSQGNGNTADIKETVNTDERNSTVDNQPTGNGLTNRSDNDDESKSQPLKYIEEESDKKSNHLLRNKAILKKIKNIKLLQEQLQTLKRLEKSRRKYLMSPTVPGSLLNYGDYGDSVPHGKINQDTSMFKTFFHPQNDQKVEEISAANKNSKHNTSISGFQDALFDRGRILKWKYRDIDAVKKQLSDHHLPTPPTRYLYHAAIGNNTNDASLSKTNATHSVNYHNKGNEKSPKGIIDQSISAIENRIQSKPDDNSEEVLALKDKLIGKLKSIIDSIGVGSPRNLSMESETGRAVSGTLKDVISEFQQSQTIDEIEKGVGRSMNEFNFNGKVKLDPNYQGNVKIVHGTPPPEFLEAFATPFPPTRITTPLVPFFTLPPGHATQQPNLPTFSGGYPWVWYKNRKLPTTSRYRNNHALFTTRVPITTPSRKKRTTVKPTDRQSNNPQLSKTMDDEITAKPSPEQSSSLFNNNTIQPGNNSQKPSNTPISTEQVDGEVIISNLQPESTNTTVDAMKDDGNPQQVTTTIAPVASTVKIDANNNKYPSFSATPNITNIHNTTINTNGNSEQKIESNDTPSQSPKITTTESNKNNTEKNEELHKEKSEKDKNSGNSTKIPGNSKSVASPIFVTYDENRRHHLQPDDIILTDSLYAETKKYTQTKEAQASRVSNPPESFENLREAQVGYKKGNAPVLGLALNNLDKRYHAKQVIENTGDKRDFQQYSSYTLNEDMDEAPVDKMKKLKSLQNQAIRMINETVDSVNESIDSNSTRANGHAIHFHGVNDLKSLLSSSEENGKGIGDEALKSLLSSSNPVDYPTNSMNDKLPTLSSKPTTRELEDFENDDKSIDSETMPISSKFFATKPVNYKIQQEPEVFQDTLMREYARLSKQSKKYTGDIPSKTSNAVTRDETIKLHGTDAPTTPKQPTKPIQPILVTELANILANSETESKFVSQPPKHDIPITSKTTTIATTPSTTSVRTTTASVVTATTTTTPKISLYKTYSTITKAPYKTSEIFRPTARYFNTMQNVFSAITNAQKTSSLPENSNQMNRIVTEDNSLDKTFTLTPLMHVTPTSPQQSKSQHILEHMLSKSQLKLKPPMQSHQESLPMQPHQESLPMQPHLESPPMQSHLESSPMQPHLESPPMQSHQESLPMQPHQESLPMQPHLEFPPMQPHLESIAIQPQIPSATSSELAAKFSRTETSNAPMDEKMNMDDMYWTDSPEEIENACRQEKGTNLVENILAFGDSLTRGYYNKGRSHHPYTMKLQYLLNKMNAKKCFIVENEGKDGDLAFGEMPKRMEEVLKESKKRYDWVIILGGTNDIYNKKHAGKHTAIELTQNILTVHEIAHQRGARTVAVTIPDVECQSTETCQDMKEIREKVNMNLRIYSMEHKNDVLLCDLADSLARHKIDHKLVGQFFEGGLHLRPRGYEKMAKIMFELLKKTLDK